MARKRHSDEGIAMDLGDEEEVLANFLQVASTPSQQNDSSTGHQRARALRLGLEIMEANVEENIQISRICEISGVSLRTLSRAYREVFLSWAGGLLSSNAIGAVAPRLA